MAKSTRDKPTHRQCRYCKEWFELRPRAHYWQKFCTLSCAASYRTSQPKWKKQHGEKVRAKSDPETMRQKSLKAWSNPEIRTRLSEKTRQRSNSKEHLAWMDKHNERLWADKEFREQHSKRASQTLNKLWEDPVYREKISAQTVELNKQRWADPEFRERVSRNIRIAKLDMLEKKRTIKAMRELAARPEEQARKSKMMKERWDDPEERTKMTKRSSETATKRWRDDPAYRKKQAVHLSAWAKSPENRKRMSEMGKNPESIARTAALWTPERRAEQAEKNRKLWADPEYKARVSAAISKAKRKLNPEA
jgi:hypothetical protein